MKLPLQCPTTRQNLRLAGHEYAGPNGISYPTVGDIPWLFPDPKPTLGAWRERASLSIDALENEIEILKLAAKTASSELTRERLEHVRTLKIRHLEMLRRVLEPLKPYAKLNLAQKKAYGYRLPLRQGLLGYFPNLIRDWSPNFETENAALLHATMDFLKTTKPVSETAELRILVLGAGASRLAYDIAKLFTKSQVVAFDLNPLLLLAAKQVNEGRKIQAVEFSVSPKDSREPGRAVELTAPHGPAANLQFIFGDVYALPFQPASFDLCISPWLVDILPRRFSDLCTSVAHVVKTGGVWLNSGSWHFDFQDESENLSLDEAAEVATASGWIPRAAGTLEIPYLQSPFDAHRRFETMTQFCWERATVDVKLLPSVDDRAEWIRDVTRPIPALPSLEEGIQMHAAMALVLSLVDGQKTLTDIAQVVAQENGLPLEQAIEAVQSFFDRYMKDRRFRETT